LSPFENDLTTLEEIGLGAQFLLWLFFFLSFFSTKYQTTHLFFFFFSVLELEFRAYTLSHSSSTFFFCEEFLLEIGPCKLFVWGWL
jgi:hypothetical protein